MSVAIGMQFQKLQKMGQVSLVKIKTCFRKFSHVFLFVQLICSDDEIERPIPFSELEMHQSHLVGSDSDATIHQSPSSAASSDDEESKIIQVERYNDM